MDNCINKIITDEDLREFVNKLIMTGYKPNVAVWQMSISYVNYECGENFSVIYSTTGPKYFDLHPNGKKEIIE